MPVVSVVVNVKWLVNLLDAPRKNVKVRTRLDLLRCFFLYLGCR